MIIGRFGDTTGRPFIEGRLILPRLNIQGNISFLMDTGADCSMVMPSDAKRLAIPFKMLEGDRECSGIGGTIHSFAERAILVFTDPQVMLYGYDLEIDIMPDDPGMEEVTSLLGRDVIDRWRITYDPQRPLLRAKPRSADITIPLAAIGAGNPADS